MDLEMCWWSMTYTTFDYKVLELKNYMLQIMPSSCHSKFELEGRANYFAV